jgi:hypothetical protein
VLTTFLIEQLLLRLRSANHTSRSWDRGRRDRRVERGSASVNG